MKRTPVISWVDEAYLLLDSPGKSCKCDIPWVLAYLFFTALTLKDSLAGVAVKCLSCLAYTWVSLKYYSPCYSFCILLLGSLMSTWVFCVCSKWQIFAGRRYGKGWSPKHFECSLKSVGLLGYVLELTVLGQFSQTHSGLFPYYIQVFYF